MLDNAMMKAYIAHSYSDMKQQSAVIDSIVLALEQLDIECLVFTRKYAPFKINQEKEMMSLVFQEIERANLLVVEMSIKRVGIGVEVGYAAACGIPILYLCKVGSDHSTTIGGTASKKLVYKDIVDLRHKLNAGVGELLDIPGGN